MRALIAISIFGLCSSLFAAPITEVEINKLHNFHQQLSTVADTVSSANDKLSDDASTDEVMIYNKIHSTCSYNEVGDSSSYSQSWGGVGCAIPWKSQAKASKNGTTMTFEEQTLGNVVDSEIQSVVNHLDFKRTLSGKTVQVDKYNFTTAINYTSASKLLDGTIVSEPGQMKGAAKISKDENGDDQIEVKSLYAFLTINFGAKKYTVEVKFAGNTIGCKVNSVATNCSTVSRIMGDVGSFKALQQQIIGSVRAAVSK